jgi:hypothetical protein
MGGAGLTVGGMEASASPTAGPEFGLGRLILADTRLGLLVLNEFRHWSLNRVFGTSRAQDNLLSLVLVLVAARTAHDLRQQMPQMPRTSMGGAAGGVLVVYEAATGYAGPQSHAAPIVAVPITAGLIGAVLLGGARRAARGLRAAERRARATRIEHYRRVRSGASEG